MPTRLFVEVDGQQAQGKFADFAQLLVANLQRAVELGGRVVTIHSEEFVNETDPPGTHKKGDGCHCKPLAFHVSAPRRIILASEVR
jgi:hypothetical protein